MLSFVIHDVNGWQFVNTSPQIEREMGDTITSCREKETMASFPLLRKKKKIQKICTYRVARQSNVCIVFFKNYMRIKSLYA